MKYVRIAVLVLFALTVCATAFADDFSPPPWRGQPGSTFGKWEFSTPNANPLPEPGFIYPYGMPSTQVTPGLFQSYLPTWGGRMGVWPLSGEIVVTIPNTQIPNPRKDIWLQLTWAMQAPNVAPAVMETRFGVAATETQRIPVDGTWFHSIYQIQIFPNPDWERILITGAVNVDEMVIDTRCVPEPASLLALSSGLLGLVGVAIRRRR